MSIGIIRLLTVLSVIFIIFAIFSLWLARDIYDTGKFTELSVETFQKAEVRDAIAAETVDRALQDRPLIKQVAGDYLESYVAGMLGNERMKNLFGKTASRLHDYVLNNSRQDVKLETGALSTAIKPIITLVSPDLAKQLTDKMPESVVLVNANSIPDINKWVGWIVATGPVLGLLAIIILIFMVYLEKNISLSFKRIGLYLAIGSLIFMLVVPYFRLLISSRVMNENRTTVVLATYDTFTKELLMYLFLSALIAVLMFAFGFFWPNLTKLIKRKEK